MEKAAVASDSRIHEGVHFWTPLLFIITTDAVWRSRYQQMPS